MKKMLFATLFSIVAVVSVFAGQDYPIAPGVSGISQRHTINNTFYHYSTVLQGHISNINNPHNVTAAQVGAPTTAAFNGYTSSMQPARTALQKSVFDSYTGTRIPKSIGVTKGDIAVYDGVKWQRLPVGSDGQFIVYDSTQPLGIKTTTVAPGSGASATSTYIIKTPDAGLSNAFALSTLSSGIVKNTTGTGVPTIATAGTDYCAPTSGTSILKGDGAGGTTTATYADVPLPPGMVAPFAIATPPTGWLACEGEAVSRTTYSGLYAAIGTMYGAGDGTTTFNVPDYRGEFLRGWNHSATTDPDAATRTDRGDGTTGDAVGTKQADQFKSHTHSTTVTSSADSAGGSGATPAHYAPGSTTGAAGGNETRPKNIYVLWCIKY